MKPTELLLQYARLGDRVRTLEDEQRHLQDRLGGDARVERCARLVAETQARRDEVAAQLRAIEGEVEGHRGQMKAHERELMSGRIRSPSDLTRMSEEVGHMKARLADEEDVELDVMTTLETADAELAEAQRESNEARAAYEAELPEIRRRLQTIEAEVAELEVQRSGIWADVPPELQAAYRKISRIPNPVVAMSNGQCEGCRVQLTANELQQLRRGERFTCQNCNRILVEI
jgi:predicted  nucleic acid-binding Zn-ribbon protein